MVAASGDVFPRGVMVLSVEGSIDFDARQQGVDHFRVADELQRRKAHRACDVVLLDRVRVALDGGQHEVLDVADVREPRVDRVWLGEIDPEATGRAADLRRDRLCARRLAPGDDNVSSLICVELRDLASEAARSTYDNDAAVCHQWA